MRVHVRNTVLVLCLSLGLTACSSVREELGLNRHSPDEFTVIKRAPLSLPPEYNLRPPKNGYEASAQNGTSQTAKQTVFGADGVIDDDNTPDTGEEVLLSKVGADKAEDNIRQTLDRENGYVAMESSEFADKVIFWKDPETDASLIDAKAEAARLRKLAQQGEPLNGDDAPVIERKKGAIDRLF